MASKPMKAISQHVCSKRGRGELMAKRMHFQSLAGMDVTSISSVLVSLQGPLSRIPMWAFLGLGFCKSV